MKEERFAQAGLDILVPLTIGILMGLAAFLLVDPVRLIRYDEIPVKIFGIDPCVERYFDNWARDACGKRAEHLPAKPSVPPAPVRYKLASPFLDRA